MSSLSPIELVEKINNAGFYLYIEGNELKTDPDELTPIQMDFIQKHKAQLILGLYQESLIQGRRVRDYFWGEIERKDTEISLLKADIQLYSTLAYRRVSSRNSLDPQLLKQIKQLTHPDRHGGSALSTKVFGEVSKL